MMGKISKARKLRQNSPEPEKILWQYLRNKRFHGFKFRRQHPLGNYVVDFVCLSKKLVVELDGRQHLNNLHYDKVRDNFLIGKGYSVLRFWNHDFMLQREKVLEEIYRALVQ